MVTACFDKREHLGGHEKMPVGDDHPKNLVH